MGRREKVVKPYAHLEAARYRAWRRLALENTAEDYAETLKVSPSAKHYINLDDYREMTERYLTRYHEIRAKLPFGETRSAWDALLEETPPLPVGKSPRDRYQFQCRFTSTENPNNPPTHYGRKYWNDPYYVVGALNPPYDQTWMALLYYPQKEVIAYAPQVAWDLEDAGFRLLHRCGRRQSLSRMPESYQTRPSGYKTATAYIFIPPPDTSTREARRILARAIRTERETPNSELYDSPFCY